MQAVVFRAHPPALGAAPPLTPRRARSLALAVTLAPALLLAVALAACSSDPPATPSPDAAMRPDAAAPPDATTPPDATAPPDISAPPERRGAIVVESNTVPNRTARLSASFDERPAAAACTVATSGSCRLLSCASAPSRHLSAGAIAIAAAHGDSYTLSPGGGGVYPTYTNGDVFFPYGDALTVTAGGDEVPGFTAHLDAPPVGALITSPTAPADANAAITIDRAKDLAVEWASGGATIRVEIAETMGAATVSLQCDFAASAKQGTVPAALLGKLAPSTSARLRIDDVSLSTQLAGDVPVEIAAVTAAYTPGEGTRPFHMTATLP